MRSTVPSVTAEARNPKRPVPRWLATSTSFFVVAVTIVWTPCLAWGQEPISSWNLDDGLQTHETLPPATPATMAASQDWKHWLYRGDPDDPFRHIGIGHPLEGTSWRNRPWHIDCFAGTLWGDSLIAGRVGQGDNFFGGLRFGYDPAHYWGTEMRLGFSYPNIQSDSALTSGFSRNLFWDFSALYYPWGDARWRPYASLGMGLAEFRFTDDLGQSVDRVLFHLPLGLGVKYQSRRWLAWRFDLIDNLAFGSGSISTMNNWSLTAGAEVRYGSRRILYEP